MSEACPRNARLLAGAFNFRDLGGLPTSDGRVVRTGLVFRSNCFVELTAPDVDVFRSRLQIATIIDLRGPEEAGRHGPSPTDDLGLRMERLPLLDEAVTKPGEVDHLLNRYRGYLSTAGGHVVRALEVLADQRSLPAVVHCTTGKDRTGVLVALLLACLGVAPNVIARDYGATMDNRDEFVAFIKRRPGLGHLTADHPLIDADPKVMLAFLESLEADYGGASGWALSAGLPPPVLDRLRSALVG